MRHALKIRIPPAARRAAISGQEYEGVLELTAARNARLDEVALTGEGWEIISLTPSGNIHMTTDERVLVHFRAIPSDADNDLLITYRYDDQRFSKRFNIGPKRMTRLGNSSPIERTDGLPIVQPGFVDPYPPPGGGTAGQLLHIIGRMEYTRPDGVNVGADNLFFQIMDDDSPDFDEEMYAGNTDVNGNFDVTFTWDDCDITGCDDPDIYLYFETDNNIVTVQADSILEENYSWDTESDRWDDFEGSFIDFGTLTPTDSSEYPALHIYNSIVRAHRFIIENDGTVLEQVDVQCPEEDDATFYDRDFEEIHIGSTEQWIEGTHTHEYGHHFMKNHSAFPETDYCNGFCDTDVDDDDCSHCLFCRETDHDAWHEGWPNWFAFAVNQVYMPQYGITPISISDPRYAIESTDVCQVDNLPHDPLITEGFATALLTDMTDLAQDDQDRGTLDCERDAMMGMTSLIFEVVRIDQPMSALQFISAFRNRFPEFEMDFWSTSRNVTPVFGFPLPAPMITSMPQSCATVREGEPLTISVTGNGSLLKYQWRRHGLDLIDLGNISGVNTPSLTFNPLEAIDAATYDVKISTCDETLSIISPPVRVQVFNAFGGGNSGLSWGRNAFGSLGQGVPNDSNLLPNPILDISNFTAIESSPWHTVALRDDGTVWAWGWNGWDGVGALGNNSNAPSAVPVQSIGLDDVVAVAANGSSNPGTSMALTSDGRLFSWGNNSFGQLGIPGQHLIPTEIPGMTCVVSIAIGDTFSLAIKSDGTVWTWGSNYYGALGIPGPFLVTTPTQVPSINDAVEATCGAGHTVLLRADGTLLAWGRNNYGQLGDGSLVDRSSPVPVTGLNNVRSLGGKGSHTVAVRDDGTAWAWGSNGYGTLGNGTSVNSSVPVQVQGLSNIRKAGGGYATSTFLKFDGTVWVCGTNIYGGFGSPGLSTIYSFNVPVQLTTIAGATSLFVGPQSSSIIAPPISASIISQPTNQIFLVGQNATMSVNAIGTPQLAYQWLKNDMPVLNGGGISGATTATLSINPVLLSHAGGYSVSVTNSYGTNVSSTAILTVSELPGDINADGLVDIMDFPAFLDCFHGPGMMPDPMNPNIPPQACGAIFDGEADGDIDLRNFKAFQIDFEEQ